MFVHAGKVRCTADGVFPRFGGGDGDIFPDRARKEEALLQYKADRAPHRRGGKLGDILSADRDLARSQRIEPVQKIGDRRLAAPRAAEDAQSRPLLHGEGDVGQNGLAFFIAECHPVEDDIPVQGLLFAVDLFLRIHDLRDAPERDACAAHVGDDPPQHIHGADEQGVIGDKDDEIACAQRTVHAENRAEDEDEEQLQGGEKVARRPKERALPHDAHPLPRIVRVLRFELVALLLFSAERAHDAHAREVLLRDGGEHALLFVALLIFGEKFCKEHRRIPHDGGQEGGRDEREPHIGQIHQGQREHDHDDDAKERHELPRDEVGDGVDVGGAALDDIARVVRMVPGKGQPLQMRKERIAHALEHDLIGVQRKEVVAVTEKRRDERKRHDDEGNEPDIFLEPFDPAEDADEDLVGRRDFLRADDAVHRKADELRDEHEEKGHKEIAEDAHGEQPQAPLQKIDEHPRLRKAGRVFALFHRTPKSGQPDIQAFCSCSRCACKV